MIGALVLSTYVGYLSAINNCRNFDCTPLPKPKPIECKISVSKNQATVFGTTYSMRRVAYGRTTIWEGWNENLNLVMIFRPADKILRAHVSLYSDAKTYRKWTCEFHRESEPGW